MLWVSVLVVVAVLALGALFTAVGTILIERRHPPSGRFVAVAGGRMHVLELGEKDAPGPPIVLLHGASGNLEDMRLALGNRLASAHRVILIDRPGHGWSDRPGGRLDSSPARQAAYVREVLDQLGVRRAIIVSHSWAGSVATAFALANPARTAGLVLLAPATHPWTTGIAWHYTAATSPVGFLFAHTLALPGGWFLMGPAVTEVFAPQPAPDDYVGRAAIRLVLRPSQFLANAQDVADLKDFVTVQAPHYSEIRTPTVIITGDRDSVVSRRIHSEALAAQIPGAQLIVLPNVGHMPHFASPQTVVDAIDRILARERVLSPG